MKTKYLLAYMDMTCRFAETSEATRLKVGASLIKNDSIIALGVNGMPPKWPTEICEHQGPEGLVTKPECRHAEVACLEKLYKSPETAEGSTMFISHSPCKFCAIKIFTAGIKSVYYRNTFRCDAGIKYLVGNGVVVKQI